MTRPLVVARALRAFTDGFGSVLLARYLTNLGFSAFETGVIITATLLGSAVLTLYSGLRLGHWHARTVLYAACGLMIFTGFGFAAVTRFWPLLVVAFFSTLNPSGGDVSVFLPTEQAVLADLTDVGERPHRFAFYNFGAALAAAAGALASALPDRIARERGWELLTVQRVSFLLYAVVAVVIIFVYRRLRIPDYVASAPRRGLHRSRGIVLRLSALFSLDSAGGRDGGAVDSRAVPRPALRPLARGDGRDARGRGRVVCDLAVGFGSARGAHRARAHHGVHALPREHLLGPRRHRAQCRSGDHVLVACARRCRRWTFRRAKRS